MDEGNWKLIGYDNYNIGGKKPIYKDKIYLKNITSTNAEKIDNPTNGTGVTAYIVICSFVRIKRKKEIYNDSLGGT